MKDLLPLHVKKFLESRLVPNQPLLIGYSGGPDSKALLYLLLECRRFFPFELHVAHVDHGWREESMAEAEQLRAEVHSLGLPFYLNSLTLKDFYHGNTEEQGREQRQKFFSEIYSQIKAQALLLGHHSDDQAETVLKRIFEGAPLFSLGGLSVESMLKEMKIWRPLLSVKKKDIIQWLVQRGLNFFEDKTNRDRRYLRGKMREDMFPILTASFGKEISGNLCQLGEESKEIKEFFRNLNHPILALRQIESEGSHFDLNPYLPLPIIQLKYLIRSWLEQEKITLSRQMVNSIACALNQKFPMRKFYFRDGEILIDKGCLSIMKRTKV